MRTKNTLLAAAIARPIVCSRASAQVCGSGVFLGRLSANPYAPDPISSPYSQYGSPYSPISPNNPYATQAPILCGDGE